jgi:2-polyprenyl-3-methyl-5-hydroxy-6-metoxy-1,4-benzoquinol methylase
MVQRPNTLSNDSSAMGVRRRFLEQDKFARCADLTFEDFRRLAQDSSLSRYEKIGFPDEYRKDFEALIFKDIREKLAALEFERKIVADIGPGCSELPLMLANLCQRRGHRLTWIDSAEMLAHLPDPPFVEKLPGRFPTSCRELLETKGGTFDAVLAYSVLHYVMPGADIFAFLDAALALLAPGGALLIGDVPNVSMRKRFFAADAGKRFHHSFVGSQADPSVEFNVLEPGRIDDSVVLSLLMRARGAGFHAYLLPQGGRLPMANRREDILVVRP